MANTISTKESAWANCEECPWKIGVDKNHMTIRRARHHNTYHGHRVVVHQRVVYPHHNATTGAHIVYKKD